MKCLNADLSQWIEGASRRDLVFCLLEDFLSIQEMEEGQVISILEAFRHWVAERDFQSVEVSCRSDGLEISLEISAGNSESLRLCQVDCNRFSCP